MTRRTYFPAALVGSLLAGSLLGGSILVGLFLSGCRPACDIVPTQSLAHLRIIDAIGDVPVLTIRIDSGKIFDNAYYDLDRYTAAGAVHPLKYLTNYQDGSGLSAGPHRLTAYGTDPTKALVDTTLVLTEQSETLVYAGLESGLARSHPRVIQLYDEWSYNCTQCPSRMRFVQAVPDLPDSGLDVYFLDTGKGPAAYPNIANPNIRIRFGQITDEHGRGQGTGKSFSDYVVLSGALNTLITVFKDTSIAGTIVRLPYSLSTGGLFNTILIRGRGTPVDTQAGISLVVMRDGPQFGGSTSINFRTFGVRLVNATRLDSMSLLIANPGDKSYPMPRSTDNTPYPAQQKVLSIPKDSASEFLDLFSQPAFFDFWFASAAKAADTLFRFREIPHSDERFTFIALDTHPLGYPSADYDSMVLLDTTSIPADSNVGRVRFINASPDHKINFTFAGKSYSLKQRDVVYADTASGHIALTVSDGAKSGPVQFDLTHDSPVSIIFTASTAAKDLPYAVARK